MHTCSTKQLSSTVLRQALLSIRNIRING